MTLHSPLADPRDRLAGTVPRLRAFARSLARDPTVADDLVQETILKAWLFTILRNTYYSALRKTRREVPDPDGLRAAARSEAPGHEARLAFKDFQRAFFELSPEHREVLILIGASGFSCEEAAGMMGVAVGTVKSRASRARRRLADLLHLQEGETLFSDTDRIPPAGPRRSGSQGFR